MSQPDHQYLYQKAIEATRALIADTSVPRERTKKELEEIRDEVEMWIDDLNEDGQGADR